MMRWNRKSLIVSLALIFVAVSAFGGELFPLWPPDKSLPKADECPSLEGVEFAVIKPNEPHRDGYHWLHGVAVCWHKGKLYASFGHNKGSENTATEEARGQVSIDGGRTWGAVSTIDPGEDNLGVSHGVFLSHKGTLWAFQGAFYDRFQRTHTRGYTLDEATGRWQAKGVVVGDGFWPMQEPLKMDDGNWIMAGARIAKGYDDMEGNLPAVAISHGEDLTRWDLVVIPSAEGVPAGSIWGESTIIVDGLRILNISRWGQPIALASVSFDYGRTWTPTRPSNLPMAASKPYAGVLSTGQRYLICTTTADSGNRRSPLTIAVSRPGDEAFSRVFVIRDAVHDGPGESDRRARLSYPYAVEHEGKLYVVYSNSGSRGGNRNSAELAIIPIASLSTAASATSLKQPTTADRALVGSWSFEDIGDAHAQDTVGNHGKIHGHPKPAPGVVGSAMRLNGSSDYVAIPHSRDLVLPRTTFSISAWVNIYGLNRGQQMIVAKNVYSAGQREWGLMIDNDNRFRFYLQQDGWQTVGSKTIPTAGLWYHLAVTMDAGRARLYVNGRLEGDAVLGSSIPRTTAPLTFGGINDGGQLRQMLFGAIDEISLYRIVLTVGAVQTLADRETSPHQVPEPPTPYELWAGALLPRSAEIPVIGDVEFSVIKPYEPEVDGGNWLLGVGLAWHNGKLYASYGFNTGSENTATEEAHVRVSKDGGKTWGESLIIDSDEGNLGISHGVFLSRGDELWAFQGAFYDHFQRTHTRAYVLDEATDTWQPKGVVVGDGFWPMQEPLKMDDGNWIMAGARVARGYDFDGHLPAVAISHGDDLTQWDLMVIPNDERVPTGSIWGESTVIVDGSRILNISRWGGGNPTALASVSSDYGRTWTPTRPSNLPMAASKPYAGMLSTGQRYLVCTTTADSGNRRSPLTIAVSRPGEEAFSRVFVVRHAVFPEGPGPSSPGATLCYPYAVEHDGKLYVGYAVKNHRTAEMAVIPVSALAVPDPVQIWSGGEIPRAADIPYAKDVEFHVVKQYEPQVDGYRFLHGVGLVWHKGKLYASFGHNKGPENTGTEEARGRVSSDGGKTWGEVFTIDSGRDNLAVSHGVFLSHEGTLWAFQGAFYNVMERIHTRAYVLDETTGQWQAKGVVVEGGFWPMQEPLKMDDGNWIMSGFAGGPPGVAISHGDDLTKWDLVVIPRDSSLGRIWGESTVIVEGNRVINVSRYGEQAVALVAVSEDYGRTWTPSRPSNLLMATSKPYTGTLSTGQHYLICTTTADSGGRRHPLTIALTRPGETEFCQVFRIRDAEHDGPGESHPRASLAYPYAVEHEGHLYVGYSNSGGGVGREGSGRELWNNNSAELAVIPIASLAISNRATVRDPHESRLWGGPKPFPPANRIPPLTDVSYHIVHPLTEGWEFLHGAAITEFKGTFFVSFAHNPGKENTRTETLRCRRSVDGGRTWTEPEFIGPGFPGEERHSHGVFLRHQDRLWAFAARFGEGEPGRFQGLKTEAFVLNETMDGWESRGIVAQNCWPMDHPTLMDNGNWVMGGLDRNWRSVVAVSRGRNLTQWDTIAIPYPEGTGFLETSVIVAGPSVTAFIRNAPTVAVATSQDFGHTWSSVRQSDYPMSAAQPFASTLSTGQRYLISNIANRDTLAIAVSRPGERDFVRVWSIRHGRKPHVDYQGRTTGGAWAYPCAYEHDGKLYVVYSVQKLECELAIIPLTALTTN